MTKTIQPVDEDNRRWYVVFTDLAYDGGGSHSWEQLYRTKIGAYFSMYRHVYISSWGGKAELFDLENRENRLLRTLVH
jgi:hypothetical protein